MTNPSKNISAHTHGYHLVNPSPWPLLTAFSAFITVNGGVLYMHTYQHGGFISVLGFMFTLLSITC
jgi:hypothetical protein